MSPLGTIPTPAGPSAIPLPIPALVETPLQRLRSVLLLGGSIRPNDLRRGIGRSPLDLPIGDGRTVLDLWRDQVATMADAVRWESPNIRLLIDQRTTAPIGTDAMSPVDVVTLQDRNELRGTGGVLRDVTEAFDDDDYVLVANAAQIFREPLLRIAAALTATAGEVALVAHDDGSPSSLALVRCGALRSIRSAGYIDFKEQFLPQIAGSNRVTVVRRRFAIGMPVRSLSEYIATLRVLHVERDGDQPTTDQFGEAWTPTFSVIESAGDVHLSAGIYDSVVLRGGRVERNAVLVRSVVCPGAVVPAGSTLIDRVVASKDNFAASGWWRRLATVKRHILPRLSQGRPALLEGTPADPAVEAGSL